MDAISLEIFRGLFASIAEEMGVVLGRSGFSINITERRDYSCAVFDPEGRLVAQAAHLPVHLGSMPASVGAVVTTLSLDCGDIAILNDPYVGGTHLPDITMVAPVHDKDGVLIGYVANRAHHADIGGASPGSMPLATELFQEGLIIPPVKLSVAGRTNDGVFDVICRNARTPDERRGDLTAQISCIGVGSARLVEIADDYGLGVVHDHMAELLRYAETLTRAAIESIPDGEYHFEDVLDGDGLSDKPICIAVTITVTGGDLVADFTGTAPEVRGPVNAVKSVTASALLYVLLSISGEDVPANEGSLAAARLIAPEGSVVAARSPRAVSAGNVETSQRIVDVLYGALAQAIPDRIPAASQGTMNNLAFGGYDATKKRQFAYYETIAGGMGARHGLGGISAIHTHMTNTLNTPTEVLEFEMPLRVREYSIRRRSGGDGGARGGDGIRRSIEFLAPVSLSVISDRRKTRPYGLAGGQPGAYGANTIRRSNGSEETIPSKAEVELGAGDILTIETPGGGGHGTPKET